MFTFSIVYRLRIDFADLDIVPSTRRDYNEGSSGGGRDSYGGSRGGGRGGYHSRGGRDYDDNRRYSGRGGRSPDSGDEFSPRGGRDSRGGGLGGSNSELASVSAVADLCQKTPKVWDGGLILKNSLFPTKLHVIEGDRHIAESLKDEDDRPNLKITQRLRLDQSKLDDVTRRMSTATSHAVFLGKQLNLIPGLRLCLHLCLTGMPTSVNIQSDNPEVQSRPLRNLISYLKQKEAAGVISMAAPGAQQGVLYCFPPCDYSMDLLRREAPDLVDEGRDEFLVVVVVCGS